MTAVSAGTQACFLVCTNFSSIPGRCQIGGHSQLCQSRWPGGARLGDGGAYRRGGAQSPGEGALPGEVPLST